MTSTWPIFPQLLHEEYIHTSLYARNNITEVILDKYNQLRFTGWEQRVSLFSVLWAAGLSHVTVQVLMCRNRENFIWTSFKVCNMLNLTCTVTSAKSLVLQGRNLHSVQQSTDDHTRLWSVAELFLKKLSPQRKNSQPSPHRVLQGPSFHDTWTYDSNTLGLSFSDCHSSQHS